MLEKAHSRLSRNQSGNHGGEVHPHAEQAFLRLAAVTLCLALLPACQITKPLKGGTARITTSSQSVTSSRQALGGPASRAAAPASSLELTQPENPATPSSQTRAVTNAVEMVLPAGTVIRNGTDKTNATDRTEVVLAAPTAYRQVSGEVATQTIGAAQKDNARELGARLTAMRPVQWVGILLILGACALAYFQWWTKAAICGAVGIGMIVVAAVLPGHEVGILAVGGVVVGVGLPVVLYVYHKGALDHLSAGLTAKNAENTKDTKP